MRVFDPLGLYRKTLKRFRPAHVVTHAMMTGGVLPLLEMLTDFRTMPNDPFWLRWELLMRRYEPGTAAQLDRLVRPGTVMLDVGAHVGYYARRYARTVGVRGHIFAFEPHPLTFATSSRNVRRLTNVTPVALALSDVQGTAQLHDFLLTSASSSLRYDRTTAALQESQRTSSDVAPRIGRSFIPRTYPVRTTTADAYLDEQRVERVDVIKLDVEGAEILVLRGMERSIARSPGRVLVMEYNPRALRAFGHEPEEALAEVLDLGFRRVQAIEPSGQVTDLTRDADRTRQLTRRLTAGLTVVNLLFTGE
jgi:FkbM family methyltransferase